MVKDFLKIIKYRTQSQPEMVGVFRIEEVLRSILGYDDFAWVRKHPYITVYKVKRLNKTQFFGISQYANFILEGLHVFGQDMQDIPKCWHKW